MTPLEQVITDRIRALWEYRSWWRANRHTDWPPSRNEQMHELRQLVALMRKARDISRGTPKPTTLHLTWPSEVRARSSAAPDPIDLAKAYAEWQDAAPGELTEAFGR